MKMQHDDLGLSDLEINVPALAQAYYNQHRTEHGSYKGFVNTPEYSKLMLQRYEWVDARIQETITSKYKFNRRNKKC